MSVDLSMFYNEVDGELVEKPRPPTFKQAQLDVVIADSKPLEVVTKFAELVELGIQWDWFEEYKQWLEDMRDWNYQLSIFEATEDEPEFNIPEPVEPIRPEPVDRVAPHLRKLFIQQRSKLVGEIKVEVDGMVFDGDEISQQRMARAILVLREGEKTTWVLADNTVALPTKEQLTQALKEAGLAQTDVWTM